MVVHVDDKPSFRKIISEDVVHERLKHRRRIALAEEHHHRFIKPIRSSESGLPLISLLNPNIVVSPSDIQFRKVAGMFQCVDEIGDSWKGVSILDGVRIDISIVLAWMEHSILLQNKEEGRCLQGL